MALCERLISYESNKAGVEGGATIAAQQLVCEKVNTFQPNGLEEKRVWYAEALAAGEKPDWRGYSVKEIALIRGK